MQMYGKREVSSDIRLMTSDFTLQTLDVIFHSFYFGLHTSDLSLKFNYKLNNRAQAFQMNKAHYMIMTTHQYRLFLSSVDNSILQM
jgi:hypothetical protein